MVSTKKTKKPSKKKESIITIPDGITAELENGIITLRKGNKSIQKKISTPEVKIEIEGNHVKFNPVNERRLTLAILHSLQAHVKNMVVGLEKGFYYKLSVVHAHFPMNITKKENRVEISNYLGEKHPRIAFIKGNDTQVEIKGKEITIKGSSREDVAQTAANLEKATRDTKKDQRVFQDGIYITEHTQGGAHNG